MDFLARFRRPANKAAYNVIVSHSVEKKAVFTALTTCSQRDSKSNEVPAAFAFRLYR